MARCRRYTDRRRYLGLVRERVAPWALGLLAAVLSLLRLVWQSPDALTTLLWAEDGLFPLCVVKSDALSCLVDPFAGYLLFAPRVIAAGVALFPMEQWPLLTNLAAAAIAGVSAGIAFASMRAYGHTWAGSLLASLLIVLAPLVGLEAINAVGSVYMPLVFASAIALAFPPRTRAGLVGLGILLAVTILTIPSAIVLVAAVGIMAVRGRLGWLPAGIYAGILTVGVILQWWIGSTAETARNLTITGQGLTDWITALPLAVVSFWPGLYFGEATIFGMFVIPPFTPTGLVLVVAVLAIALWSAVRGSAAISVLLIAGLGLGAIPTLTGYASNRYFVLPAVLWAVAVVLAVDDRWGHARRWLMPVILVASVVVWSPAFPASEWRAGASPVWGSEIERLRAECAGDPGRVVQVRFSPDWPMEMTVLDPITTADALCAELQGPLGIGVGAGFGPG